MPIELKPIHQIGAGATRLVRVNFEYDLDSDTLLTGTPTVVEVTTTDLTLANKKVNTVAYTDTHSGVEVAIGKAVEFTVSGGTAGTLYRIRVTVSTASSPAETLVYDLLLAFV